MRGPKEKSDILGIRPSIHTFFHSSFDPILKLVFRLFIASTIVYSHFLFRLHIGWSGFFVGIAFALFNLHSIFYVWLFSIWSPSFLRYHFAMFLLQYFSYLFPLFSFIHYAPLLKFLYFWSCFSFNQASSHIYISSPKPNFHLIYLVIMCVIISPFQKGEP